MDELKDLKQRLQEERPAEWEALPDLALYMDQLISYMPRQLIRFDEGEGALTSAMVNNYSKDGLLPRADGKRYSQEHLASLTVICALKKVLSLKEMSVLLSAARSGEEGNRGLYDEFRQALDDALTDTAEHLPEDTPEEEISHLALELALRSYANQLACARVVELLRQKQGIPEGKSGKKERK